MRSSRFPPLAMLQYSALGSNVVCDGNSITAGAFASSSSMSWPSQMAEFPPFSGLVSLTNCGISGQTIRQMDGQDSGSSGDVDSAFQVGKDNVLFLQEGTNSIEGGRSGAQAADDMAENIANRLALHPWYVIVITTLPFIRNSWSQTFTDEINEEVNEYNRRIRGNARACGASVCDLVAAGSPFLLPDYTLASFEAPELIDFWASGEDAGTHIHTSDLCNAWIGGQAARAACRIPVR